MLELANPFAREGGVLRLLEPPEADARALAAQVVSGEYGRPFVIEEAGVRSLYFTRDFIQTEMRLADPDALAFAYTRRMAAFVLFVPAPREILMLGLGGGSLARWCLRHLPGARVTAVEVDPDVIAFREQFLLPPDGPRLRVLAAEAAQFVAQCEERFDVVLVDAFDRDGVAPGLDTPAFHAAARALLTPRGLLVANLVGEPAGRAAHLATIRAAYEGNALLLPIADDGNYLAFAFRDPDFEPRWRWIGRQAQALRARYGLELPAFAQTLERSRKLGYLRRELHPRR